MFFLNKKNKIYPFVLTTLILVCHNILAYAQGGNATNPEMADLMRQSGKIYVVVGVIVIIFVGIALFLWSLDKKITKLEKQS